MKLTRYDPIIKIDKFIRYCIGGWPEFTRELMGNFMVIETSIFIRL
jgi:hypothetical protein